MYHLGRNDYSNVAGLIHKFMIEDDDSGFSTHGEYFLKCKEGGFEEALWLSMAIL